MAEILHATLVADRRGGRWAGALLYGPSGAGKSTLALRALDIGFRLVADDRVLVWRSGDNLFGKAPGVLHGLMEVRGVGVVPAPQPLQMAEIALVVNLNQTPERFPNPATFTILGMDIPALALSPGDPDAALRLRAALAAAQHGL